MNVNVNMGEKMFNPLARERDNDELQKFERNVRKAAGFSVNKNSDGYGSNSGVIDYISTMRKDLQLIFTELGYPIDVSAAIEGIKADKDNLARIQEDNIRLQRELDETKEKLSKRKWLSEYTDDELEKEQEKRHLAKMIQAHLKPGVQFSLMDTEYVITETTIGYGGNYCYCWYPGSKSIQLGCEVVLRAMNLI